MPPDPSTLASITGCCVTSTIVVRHVLSCRFQVTMNIIFRLLYLSICLLATCEATSWVKHRAVTEDAEYLFGCTVTKKFGVTFILCSYTLCFVCTVCNLAVLVYLLICLAQPFLLLLEANLCPRLSHLFELCHCTFLIIYMKVFYSLPGNKPSMQVLRVGHILASMRGTI